MINQQIEMLSRLF